jgi:hypothetical protein
LLMYKVVAIERARKRLMVQYTQQRRDESQTTMRVDDEVKKRSTATEERRHVDYFERRKITF